MNAAVNGRLSAGITSWFWRMPLILNDFVDPMTVMSDRIQKRELVRRLAQHMQTDEKAAEVWLEGFVDVLYEAFKEGQSVTLPGLGGFYVCPQRNTWVFKFNPAQRLRALFGWSSTYKGEL